MKYAVKIGSIIDVNFNSKEDAALFASGYNVGTKSKDFEYGDFDTDMERRGFEFSHKVWVMLNHHAEEEKFKTSKAVIIEPLPRRFKPSVADKIFSQPR